jgi:hypothetical protein
MGLHWWPLMECEWMGPEGEVVWEGALVDIMMVVTLPIPVSTKLSVQELIPNAFRESHLWLNPEGPEQN